MSEWLAEMIELGWPVGIFGLAWLSYVPEKLANLAAGEGGTRGMLTSLETGTAPPMSTFRVLLPFALGIISCLIGMAALLFALWKMFL